MYACYMVLRTTEMEEMEEMKRTMIDFADNLSRRY